MDFIRCLNIDCPYLYRRTLHGFTEYMCTARKGKKVREYDLGSGRIIKIARLKACPQQLITQGD